METAAAQSPTEFIVIDVINPYGTSTLENTMATSPWNNATWPVVETNPTNQTYTDFASSESFAGYPTVPLVDLTTMETLVKDCWDYPTSGAMNWNACFSDHI